MRIASTAAWLAVVGWFVSGCLVPGKPEVEEQPVVEGSPLDCADPQMIVYRDDLAAHPGCSTEGLKYAPATIPGYRCAAKAYPVSGEITRLPIVLLIHGNSDDVGGWESFQTDKCGPPGATAGKPMVAERLSAKGYRVLAVDMRTDRTQLTGSDPADCKSGPTCNVEHSIDHGWGVPIVQHFIKAVLDAYPTRQVSLVGHSYGVTAIRDALRRLYINDGVAVWQRIDDVILLSGGNRGVSNACGYATCGVNTTMRGRAACQIGNRDGYQENCWSKAINGPNGIWDTPCGDGQTAFGRPDACGGHTVQYSTIVMEDLPNGAQQDLCVSEAASRLNGANNLTVALTSFDESQYFYCGALKNHFASQRSTEALGLIETLLGD